MKFVPNAVASTVARQILVGKKHSPTILFVGGVAGVVATTVTACRATLKLEDVLEEAQADMEKARTARDEHADKYSDKDYKHDMLVLYVRSAAKITKLYGPSLLLGVASITMLTGSHNILQKRNAALTAAYAAVDKGFKDYRKRVVDEYGEEKDREFRHGVVEEDEVVVSEKGKLKKTGEKKKSAGNASVYARLFDEWNSSWEPTPEYNVMFLRSKQNYLNDMLKARGHVFLNEAYDELGLPRTKAGAVVGWIYDKHGNTEGDNYIDFGIWGDENLTRFHEFITGRENAILLDFNVDGVIYDKI